MTHAHILLAADVGGTKTLLGLFASDARRPATLAVERVVTLDFPGFDAIVDRFLARHGDGRRIDAAVVGVAGPVRDGVSTLTNVPWRLEAAALAARLGLPAVRLVNDLEAMGHAVAVLVDDELTTLQPGRPDADGNRALIAPGTGLGETLLHRVDGIWRPAAAEAGHADFAARTPAEVELLRVLTARFGRVSCEHVLSGPGLTHLHAFTHRDTPCVALGEGDDDERPARITAAAMTRRCPACVTAVDLFVAALGAEAGNLGLRSVATGGVYLGGGIVPYLLPTLASETFLGPFRDKGPMAGLMREMPVHVIRAPHPALLGAAVAAAALAGAHARG